MSKVFYIVIGILVSINVSGQEKEIIFEKLTDKIVKIYYHRGNYTTNTLASYEEDGLLLIDTG